MALSLVVPKNIDIKLRRELFNCNKHKEVGCEECVRMILKKSPSACSLVTRHVSHIYPIFNPESEKLDESSPRWILPSLWNHEQNDFTGSLLYDQVDGEMLKVYEKEIEDWEVQGKTEIEDIETYSTL